jgi:hypothetical protein
LPPANNEPTFTPFLEAFEELVVQTPPKHVTVIQNGAIHLSEPGKAPIGFANDTELASVVHNLIDLGYAFVEGPTGWHPAEILKSPQERNLLQCEFTAIAWRAPGLYKTYSVPFPEN